jgi:choline monooxygenase
MKPFDIDADITRASTPPSAVYHDPSLYGVQRERIFARSWQLAGNAGRLKAPGHVIPFTLLPGCLDEPLLLTRDQNDAAHCMSNVCTHRGALVVEGEGHVNTLRCRYHGRRFGLDGCMQHMPEFDGVQGFPSAADDLPRLPLHAWGPLLFTSLDPAIPFEEWIRPVIERVEWLPLDSFAHDPDSSRDYLIELQLGTLHRELPGGVPHPVRARQEPVRQTRLRRLSHRAVRLGQPATRPGEGRAGVRSPRADTPTGHAHRRLVLLAVPEPHAELLPVGPVPEPGNAARPRAHARLVPHVRPTSRCAASAPAADLHRVEMEDEEIVESVQRGVRSRLYDRGRYSPRRETGTHQFPPAAGGIHEVGPADFGAYFGGGIWGGTERRTREACSRSAF